MLSKAMGKVCRILPARTLVGRLTRRAWGAVASLLRIRDYLPEAPSESFQAELEGLPGWCDILVQVENFEAGGLENVVIDLNKTLVEASYQVVLLVMGNQGPAVELARGRNLTVLCQKYDSAIHARIIAHLKPKIVIGHYCNLGIENIHSRNIPFIQVLHNIYMWFNETERRRFIRETTLTNAFVAVSEQVKYYSVSRLGVPEEKCTVITNGIDISAFGCASSIDMRSSLRRSFGFADDDFIFIDVGAINHQKNHLGTLKAYGETVKTCPNARLLIIGPVYEKHLLQELEDYIVNNNLQGKAIYVGSVSRIHSYLAMADGFVSGAFFEGCQLTLLEALKANLPIVTSNVGHASAFAGNGGVALVPPVYDIAAYNGAIWEMQSNREFEIRLANAMNRVVSFPVRPNLSVTELHKLDRRSSYQEYINLLDGYLKNRCGDKR
jgi:glycosyltransferase involved in cell wall biosynthesis